MRCFLDLCMSFCPISFVPFIICQSMMNGFWVSLWYLQTFDSFMVSSIDILIVTLYTVPVNDVCLNTILIGHLICYTNYFLSYIYRNIGKFYIIIASIARCELNSNMCVRRWINIYDQYQPEMDSKFRHRMDNRSEVQEISF